MLNISVGESGDRLTKAAKVSSADAALRRRRRCRAGWRLLPLLAPPRRVRGRAPPAPSLQPADRRRGAREEPPREPYGGCCPRSHAHTAQVLEQLTGQTPVFTKARYTVRTFGIRRNEKIACYVTVRGEKAMNLIESGLKVKEFELLRKNFSETGNFGAHRCVWGGPVPAIRPLRPRGAASHPAALPRLWDQRAHRPGAEVRPVDGHLRCAPHPLLPRSLPPHPLPITHRTN